MPLRNDNSVRRVKWVGALVVVSVIVVAQSARPEPKTFALNCAGGDCPPLTGAPQASGMRGGSVKLKPGESVGWHSTATNEEALVILHGSGVANGEGHADRALSEKTLAYIPPATRHNVTDTGTEVMEYVWVVAPTR